MCSASLPSAHLGPGLRLPPPESGPSHLPPAVKCPACSPFLRLPLRLSAPPRPASRTRADVHFMLRRGRQHTAAQTGNTLRLAALPLPHVYVHSGPQATLFLLWVPDGPSLQSNPIPSHPSDPLACPTSPTAAAWAPVFPPAATNRLLSLHFPSPARSQTLSDCGHRSAARTQPAQCTLSTSPSPASEPERLRLLLTSGSPSV